MSNVTGLYPILSPRPLDNGSPEAFLDAVDEVCGCAYRPLFSGRSALLAGLGLLGFQRTDEVLVPLFLGQCVLSAISHTAFPAHEPSARTRAVMVLHQFGFPQDMEAIGAHAAERGWRIVNNCAHALYADPAVSDWGDVTIASFSKFFSCGFGGGLRAASGAQPASGAFGDRDAEFSAQAFEDYARCLNHEDEAARVRGIQALFGYLPLLRTFPLEAARFLPSSAEALRRDRDKRRKALAMAVEAFPELEEIAPQGLAPMAVPIPGKPEDLLRASEEIRLRLDVEAPVLHFDFARNVLRPDYRPALMIGCHAGWTEARVEEILDLLVGHIQR